MRRCGGPSSPKVSRGKPSPSRQNALSNSPDGDYAAAVAAATTVSGALNKACLSLPDRTSATTVGRMNKDAVDGFSKGSKACGERKKSRRRISSAVPGTTAAAASSTNQSVAAVTKTPPPVCSSDGDASKVLPLSDTASSPGKTHMMSQHSSLNAATKRGHRGKRACRVTVVTGPTVAGVGASRRYQKQEGDYGASLDDNSTERRNVMAIPVSSPQSKVARAGLADPYAAPDATASESKSSSYGGYPPYSWGISDRCASVEPDFGVTSFGFGCFFPSPPPPPDARGNGGGDRSVYCDVTGGYRGGGGVVQEARACAPAQHLANLRALLDGDEEEQLAAVAKGESSESEDDREAGGEGTQKSGGGENGVKGNDESGAGEGFTRA